MKDRRSFFKTAGVALLATSALSKSARANVEPENFKTRTYTVGLVSNPALPGPSGELVLNVYMSVDESGTGIGTISDPVHAAVNSHVAVQESSRHGNHLQFEGEILRSNDPARIGLAVQVSATVHGDLSSQLDVVVNGETFSGTGVLFTGVSFRNGIVTGG